MRFTLSESSKVKVFEVGLLVNVPMLTDAQFLIFLCQTSAFARTKHAAVVPLVVLHLPFLPHPILTV